jgi:hypothetical protein
MSHRGKQSIFGSHQHQQGRPLGPKPVGLDPDSAGRPAEDRDVESSRAANGALSGAEVCAVYGH